MTQPARSLRSGGREALLSALSAALWLMLVSTAWGEPTADTPVSPTSGPPIATSSGTPGETEGSGQSKEEAGAASAGSTTKPSPGGIVEKVLKDLDFFPYIVVVPPGSGSQIDADGTAIVPLKSLDAWLNQEVAKKIGQSSGSSVTSLDMALDISADPVAGRATMNVRKDGERSSWVTLAFGEANLKQARVREWLAAGSDVGGMKKSDEWIPAIRRSAAGFEVQLDRSGSYEITLEFFVDASRLPADRTVKLSLPSSPIMQGRVSSTSELAYVRSGASGREISLSADRKSAEVALASGEPFSIAWRRAADQLPQAHVNNARILTQVRIEPKTTQIESTIEIESATELNEGTLRFSAEDQNVQILPTQNDQPLAHDVTWNEVGNKRECVVRLARPVTGSMNWRITAQRATVLGAVGADLSAIEWVGSPPTSSMMLMWWSPNLWVRVRPGPGARRLNVADLGGEFSESSPRQAFRLQESSATVQAVAELARPVLTARAESDLVIGQDAVLTTRLLMSVRGAQADSFTFVVPRTMKHVEITPADLFRLEELEVDQESLTRQVRAVLAEVMEDKELEVTLRGEMPVEMQGINQIPLPTLDSDRFVQGSMTVRVEPGIRLVLDDAGTEYLRREPIPEEEPTDPPAYWFFRRQPGEAKLSFRIEALPTTVDSGVECLIARTEKEIDVRTVIRFRARYAPFDEVSVSIPSNLTGVQVTSDNLVENTRLEPGSVVPLRLRNPTSACQMEFDYRLPISSNDSSPVLVPLVLPRATTIETWTGRIYTERGLRATVGNGWVGTTPAPSKVVESGRRAVADIRPSDLVSVPEELPIQFEPTALLATLVIPRVTVEEVVTPDGSRWARKRWLISKHRARDISIRLPEGARRLDAFVDGQAVEEIPAGEQIVQVRLPAVDAPTSVEMDYDFPSAARRGAIAFEEMSSPVILDDSAIEQVRWSFRTMEDRLLFRWGSAGPSAVLAWLGLSDGDADAFGPLLDDVTWLNQSGLEVPWSAGTRDVVVPRTWTFLAFNQDASIRLISVREPLWILACSGSCLVFILAVSRLRFANQARVILVALILLTGLMAVLPEMLSWLWMGARWGVGLGLLATMVHWLMVLRRQRQPTIGAKRRSRRGSALGSSILRELEPRTRVSKRGARRES